ncbi:MAG TPA: hypothetical protein V6D12_14385 [Candidatus Obscuribacterales bacterium]
MSQQNLFELAKQGNTTAIATLLTRQLQPKGITIKVALKDGCLQIMLESNLAPDKQDLIEFISQEIAALEVEHIKEVKVYGRQTGENIPAWCQEFQLEKPQLSISSQSEQQIDLPKVANQGDPKAIASLLNLSLQPKGITVKASLTNGCLMVTAESTDAPHQSFIVDFVCKNITSLKVEAIKRVVVRGQTTGKTTPAWREAFELYYPVSAEQFQPSNYKNSRSATIKPFSVSKPKIKSRNFTKIINLLRNRNIERILLVGGTFILTSNIWTAVGFFKPTKLANSASQIQEAQAPVPVASIEPSPLTSDPATESAKIFLGEYLNDILNKGDSGNFYWCSQKRELQLSFFAPRNATILDISGNENAAIARIRLDSSTKSGIQMTNNWQIYMEKEEDPTKEKLLPGGWCIASISQEAP